VGEALVVDSVRGKPVRGPLQDTRLPLLAVEAERSLVGAETREQIGRSSGVLFPLTKTTCCSWNDFSPPRLLKPSKHSDLPPLGPGLEFVAPLRVVRDVEGVVPCRKLWVVPALDHEGVGLPPHHVDLGDQQPVDVP